MGTSIHMAPLGRLSFSWDDAEGLGKDLEEKDALFVLRFRIASVGPALATLEFGDFPIIREITVQFNPVPWQSVGARLWIGTKRSELRLAVERRGTDSAALFFPVLAGAEFIVETADKIDGMTWRSVGTVSGSVVDRSLALPLAMDRSTFYRFRLATPPM